MLRSYDADGYIYCCGNRFMPPAVQKSLTQCFIKGKKVSPEVAEEKVVDMYIKGRYNVGQWISLSCWAAAVISDRDRCFSTESW